MRRKNMFRYLTASFITGGTVSSLRTTVLRSAATTMSSDPTSFGMKWHRSAIRCKMSPGEEGDNETGKVAIAHGSVEFCEATLIGPINEPRGWSESLDAFIFFFKNPDPATSVKFYEENFGMRLVDVYHSTALGKSNYYLASLRKGESWPEPGSREAHERLFDMDHNCVELMHDHGAENDPDLRYNNGNEEPHRGFGHLALLTDDVYKASEQLEKAGVSFKKKPDEGRMKGLAFAYDPDGYWIEIVARDKGAGHPEPYNLGQTMLRIKDVEKSLNFYTGEGGIGMTKVRELHLDDFSLYFLQSLSAEEISSLPAPDSPSAYERMNRSWAPVLELTHNHGTEKDPEFSYHSGNTKPEGFGYLGFIVDDLEVACKRLAEKGARKIPEPEAFAGKLARFEDPDGYHVQLALRKAVVD